MIRCPLKIILKFSNQTKKVDYYQILNVPKQADLTQIKNSYYKLAKDSHPDRNGDEENFKMINEAYQVLSNEESRKQYDSGQNQVNQDMYTQQTRNNRYREREKQYYDQQYYKAKKYNEERQQEKYYESSYKEQEKHFKKVFPLVALMMFLGFISLEFYSDNDEQDNLENLGTYMVIDDRTGKRFFMNEAQFNKFQHSQAQNQKKEMLRTARAQQSNIIKKKYQTDQARRQRQYEYIQ